MSKEKKKIPPKYSPHAIENEIFEFWEKRDVYKKVKSREGKKFFFVDGPPYTTGRIHLGTAWNKVLKDAILRYKRMNGFSPTDTPGWDMHGLPIEVKVEQELGFKNKRDIESFGIEEFVRRCMEYALRNKEAMEEQFKMLGVWMDWENPYMTIKAEYMNAAWFTVKRAHDRGLLERKKMVVNWCPRCETALADAEIEYYEKFDPSIYVKFPIKGRENEYIVIWTTTPWTLPANMAVAVHPSLEYARVRVVKNGREEVLILAAELVEKVAGIGEYDSWEILETFLGEDLVGVEYEHPLADEVPVQKKWAHRVYVAEFVTAENTGCVHIAPGHGVEDYELGVQEGLEIFNPVDDRGYYTEEAGKYAGMNINEANDVIIDDLYRKDLLLAEEKILHRYGHCWRCKTPIIYRATEQWFLKVSEVKDRMLEEIEKVWWIPEWAGEARFKDWVSNARDWCISRQRYWGIPLPIWICEKCGEMKVVGSINEIEWSSDLDLHRPRIDAVTFECKCGGVMKRVQDVFDVWFDSGVASWGSLGYPLSKKRFEELWPADFITEGHDQTRGWFYSQLGASVICFDRAPYKSVLMHGFTLDKDGRKMSKSLGNVVEPEEVVEQIGIDGFRLYVLSSAPWEDLRFNWDEARNVDRALNVIWNAVRFAYTYMSLDDYRERDVREEELKVEDFWILSRLESFIKDAKNAMERYHVHRVVRRFMEFFVEDFSRWYIQLIRPRVWEEKDSPSKLAAYSTMFRVIDRAFKVISPIAPFISEWIFQNVVKEFRDGEESIFLEDYPEAEEELMNEELEREMRIAKEIVEAAANARNKARIKLRWPLRKLVVEAGDRREEVERAVKHLGHIIKSQSNVKELEVVEKFEKEVIIKPNYRVVGSVLKDRVKEFARMLETIKEVPEKIEFDGHVFERDAITVEYRLPEGYEMAEFSFGNVYVLTTIDDELKREAYAREVIRRIQEMRKEMDLDVEEFIEVEIDMDESLVDGWVDYIKGETRAKKMVFGEVKDGYVKEWDVEGVKVKIGVKRCES